MNLLRASRCSIGIRLLKTHSVISGRAVGSGYRLVIQSQIDAELRAVVNQVVHEHLAVGEEARSVENCVTLEAELPILQPSGIGRGRESCAEFG